MYTFEQFLEDKKNISLNGVLFNLTDQCNCRCKYCDFVQYKNSYMTKETADQAINFIRQQVGDKKINIAFFGGEPMLNWDLIEYLVKKYQDQFTWSITTNGTLLTEEKIQFFKENNVSILLSIDGDKETQDYNRPLITGRSSFDKISPHLKTLANTFPGITFRSTLYPPTVKNFLKNYFFAVSQNFISYYAIPDEYSTWTKENIEDLREGLTAIVAHYIFCLENNVPVTHFSDLDRFLCEYLIAKKNQNQNFIFEHSVKRCGLGLTGLGIGTNGWIFGCQEHSSRDNTDIFYIGDIYNGIDEQRHYNLVKTFSEQHLEDPKQPDKCTNCLANYICHGTRCPSRNYFLSQNFDTCTDIRCEWTKLLHEAAFRLNAYFELHYCESYENYVKFILERHTNNYQLQKEMILL